MPRRKQERPKYVGSPQELAISLQNGIGSGSSSETEESDEHVCGKCRAEFPSLADFLLHKKRCSAKTPVLLDASEEDDDEDEEGDESPRPLPPQQSQWLAANLGSNVTLAELENTCVAVSQQAQLGDILYTFHRNQAQSYELLQAITKMLREAGGLAGPQVPYLHQEAPPAETNTLALLEKQAEKCIQDSMARKSFLNGMEDERSKKKGESDPACRHKCHYCGKLLGSDSALQIHLRSHTGEKPFQCSVCGSSFSTRGNLKVHCQRHREQQNLHPLPFALDHPPPLLGPDGEVKADVTKPEQALDFSKTLNGGRKSPHCESQSRSVSPNGTFSDNSNDGSSDENLNEDYSHLKIDVEQFDDEDDEEERDSNHPMDEDESPVRQSFSTSPNFAPYFFPPPYDNLGSTNGNNNNNNNNNNTGPCNENGGPEGSDSILQDPSYYQDLLPKIGSNDNSWESLIEVTKTSETSKLQQLVDNIENKLTDPNQCIICHRVLSCKSALQMHYRTHTGERPYKCKLCNRAFTTKGNLKTHMGVHRTKPPSRLMHQCPVCHRQFPNSVILQQHVQTHTAEQGLPMFAGADDRPLLPPSYPRQFQPLALTKGDSPRPSESVIRPTGVMEGGRNESSPPPPLSRSCSPASEKSPTFESPPKEPVNGSSEKDEPMEEAKAEAKAEPSPKPAEASPMEVVIPPEPKYSSHSIIVPTSGDCPLPFGMPPYPPLSCSAPYTASLTALENHVKSITSNVTHPLPFPPHYGLSGFFPPRDGYGFSSSNGPKSSPKSSSDAEEQCTTKGDSQKESAGAPLDLTPRGSPAHFQRPTADLKMFQPLVGLPFGPPTTHRISTTCRVCYKTFACNSALEIHYRSHTKERPFRCEVCDRGFSTKGNMRQHMLTHKIRDFPSPAAFSEPEAKITPPPPAPPKKEEKRPEPPKRAPGQPKHMCQVCHKPFSSGSALQIHMRTHTGDKPFQCNICHRAFTTKGNLKVHMGTHMWNNSTSRRGRRMSLDITPLQLAPGGKPGEFVQAAPFFPYLAPFMNGLPPPPPKMNEISVIQTAGQQPLALLAKEDVKAKEETQQPPQVGAWPWKISCNACNKICGSSTELELHVRNNHCNNSNGSSNKEPSTAETERTD